MVLKLLKVTLCSPVVNDDNWLGSDTVFWQIFNAYFIAVVILIPAHLFSWKLEQNHNSYKINIKNPPKRHVTPYNWSDFPCHLV